VKKKEAEKAEREFFQLLREHTEIRPGDVWKEVCPLHVAAIDACHSPCHARQSERLVRKTRATMQSVRRLYERNYSRHTSKLSKARLLATVLLRQTSSKILPRESLKSMVVMILAENSVPSAQNVDSVSERRRCAVTVRVSNGSSGGRVGPSGVRKASVSSCAC
jgi:hypothetical protein